MTLLDLRIVVQPSTETNDHEVRFLADEVDLIAGLSDDMLGLDPSDVLIEPCPLRAAPEPRAVTIARCSCGYTGCASIEVVIERDAETIAWRAVDGSSLARFRASSYDAELARALLDFSWETPERTAARLIANGVDRAALREHGLTFGWASGRVRTDFMSVSLLLEPGPYQVLVHVPWSHESVEEIAALCSQILARPPRTWSHVTWSPQAQDLGLPPIAGPGWATNADG